MNENSAVTLKLPTFWTNLPTAWFLNIESQFQIRRVTDELTKYHYVVQSLPQDVIASVYDVMCEPSDTPYTDLKKVLVDRHTASESKRVEELLSNTAMGDRKPSEFYRSLKNLAGSSALVSDQLVIELWSRRLPILVQTAVKSCGRTDIKDLLVMADSIFEVYQQQSQNSLFAVTTTPSTSSTSATSNTVIQELIKENQSIRSEISEIKKMLSATHLHPPSRSRNRFPSNDRSRSRSKSRSSNSSELCWYHEKYGTDAKHCRKPCKFNQGN